MMDLVEFRNLCRADDIASTKAGAAGRITARVFRIGQLSLRAKSRLVRIAARLTFIPLDLLWTRIAMGAELPRSVICGGGFAVCHGRRGVIINGGARLGERVTILHQVTIGNASPRQEVPVIGNDVFIGAKASIIGGVHVGDGALVGAHALVVRDVPAGYVARGPAADSYARREG